MNDQGKKMNPEETPKDEKIQLTDDEAEKAAGGAREPGKQKFIRPTEVFER